jgi:hypothetical protein
MKYIVVTEVDAKTKVLCTDNTMRTGPSMPAIKGLNLDWADRSTWPVELDQTGKYLRAPKYYATCDDDANTTIAGVLEVLTEQEWMQRKHDEFYARRPYASWLWDEATFTWSSPVPYPEGAGHLDYLWDEETVSWVERKPVDITEEASEE